MCAEQVDYSTIYSIKDVATNTIAPKYFDMDDINQLNIGLFGYNTEMIANTTEDSFNAISTFLKEMFPNKAMLPESIYNYASLFQLNNLFANPASLDIMIFINEKDIINSGENKGSFYEFILDSDLIIDIEGKQFMLDYDILITAKPYLDNYIFTSQYRRDYNNTLSNIIGPYIVKNKRIKYTGNNYLGLFIKVRQVNKTVVEEQVFTNDKINFPTFTIPFVDQLANFEVFYKSPDSNKFIQLDKRLINTTPIKTPFCYYTIKNENEIVISFSSQDKYFQPKFNSEFKTILYTTLGSNGNFPAYTGSDVVVNPKSEVYQYNNSIVIFGIPQSESVDGTDYLTLDELKSVVVEMFSTVDSYTTENDLQLYFSNFKYKYGNEILFIKKRDDAFERVFSAFALLKDKDKNIYPTNSLRTVLLPTEFDIIYQQDKLSILKPGHIFRYIPDSTSVQIIPDITLADDITALSDEYLFTNIFLISVGKSPGVVGYYINSVNSRLILDYKYVNFDSIVQFICNSVNIYRNALIGETQYKITLVVSPTLDEMEPVATNEDGVITDLNTLKMKIMLEDKGVELCYLDTTLVDFDPVTNLYTFEAVLETNDYMTSAQYMQALNVNNIDDGVLELVKLIPMCNCKLNIYAFYKYSDTNPDGSLFKLPHIYDHLLELQPYSLTNIYTTAEARVNFINPISIVRSSVKFNAIGLTDYDINISSVPFVEASIMKDSVQYEAFMKTILLQYNYMQNALSKVTNNYGLDMKFYNTYGKSINFIAGDHGIPLDRVNIEIYFNIKPAIGVDYMDLIRDLKIFTKTFIEGINVSGSNGIYISNLIKEIENQFSTVKYMKFTNINEYDSTIQVIENKTPDLALMTKIDRINFIPEYLTIKIDDINIGLL